MEIINHPISYRTTIQGGLSTTNLYVSGTRFQQSAYGEVYISSPGFDMDFTTLNPQRISAIGTTDGYVDPFGNVTISDSQLVIGSDGAGLYEVHFSLVQRPDSNAEFGNFLNGFTQRLNVNGAAFCKISNAITKMNPGLGTRVGWDDGTSASGLFRFIAGDVVCTEAQIADVSLTGTVHFENYHLWIKRIGE